MTLTTRKWLEIVRFEVVYQLRRKSTWLFFAVFLLTLNGQTNGQILDARAKEIAFNAPLLIAETSIAMSLIALLVIAAVAGDAATRDVQLRLEPLMHSSPIRRAYLGGRFFGAFLVIALLLAAVPLSQILATFFYPGLERELVGPFRFVAYIQPYFTLLLPNAFVATALLFSLASLVRHTLGSYLGAAATLGTTLVSSMFVGRTLGRWELAKLLDPLGFTAVGVIRSTWSPVDANSRLVGLAGGLLGNRLLWLAIAIAVLAFTHSRFRYGGSVGRARWWHRGRVDGTPLAGDDAALARSAPLHVPEVPKAFGAAAGLRQLLTVTRDSLRPMTTRWSWLLLPFLVHQIMLGLDQLQVRGTPLLPTTGRMINLLEAMAHTILLVVLIFAGELVWRERDARMQALGDAAPVPNWVRFAGKLLGLWILVVVLYSLLMLVGMAIQVYRGWYDFDPALYIQFLFGLELVGSLAFALFALSVHILVNQKHVGHVLVVIVLIAPDSLVPLLGTEHPLLIPTAAPSWRHSAFYGFGPTVAPMLWFALYWSAWTLLIAIVARLFFVRGTESGFAERVRMARQRFTRATAGAVAGAFALALFAGGFIFYNTNILNTYRSADERAQLQAEYERRYKRHESAPQPQLTATELHVELYPDRREADVRGVHHLANRTSRPIDTIHVAVSSEVTTGEIAFGRAARAAVRDDERGHRTYVLHQPLQPGESLQMSWNVRYGPRGFPARDISTSVVANGSFIAMPGWVPQIGYLARRQLSDATARKKHGLPVLEDVHALSNVAARHDRTGQERIDLKVTVGTAADQIAVAPGELRRSWTENGRRYFQYATDTPIGIGYAIFSGKYAVRKTRVGNVAIELLHHPAHDRNVARMIRGLEASVGQYTQRFGPYSHSVLRMIEYPGSDGGAHAADSAIWYQETFSLFDADSDDRRIDLPFAVVAHEVAHQFQPPLARVEGRVLPSESFAWYAALSVIEQEYGTDHLQRFLGFMRRDYLAPRARAGVPLLRASDFFLGYRKGPFAMHALREYVGQHQVDLAFRRLRAQHASAEPPYATSLDLYRELKQVTPDSFLTLLGDLIERNTFWALETRKATARPMANGAWQVSLEVTARKDVVDEKGAETNVPMNDLIEIGVFARAADDQDRGKPLYLAMHRIRTGAQTITVTVPQQPARAGIDPRHLLIDVEPDDNLASIGKTGSSPPRGSR